MAKNKRWYEKKYLWEKFRPNRKYKDRLFRFLFRDKKDLLQLYNAVNDNLSKNISLKRAIKNAMDSCIEKEILMDILVKNRAEVMHMLLTQYNEEKHMRDTYKEGYEEGEQIGEQNGYNKLLDAQIEKKLNRGKNIEEIAVELEVDVSTVEDRIKALKR